MVQKIRKNKRAQEQAELREVKNSPLGQVKIQIPAITVTGRRVKVTPLNYRTERALLDMQNKSQDAADIAYNDIVLQHVHQDRLEGPTMLQDYEDALLAEETDILLLLRWASYDSHAPFTYRCQRKQCSLIQEQWVDTSKMLRLMFECGNPECPCHAINQEAKEASKGSDYDCFAFMEAHWSEVPEDHLQSSPPNMVWRPSEDAKLRREYRDGFQGLEFHCRHHTTSERKIMVDYQLQDSPELFQKALERMVKRISWPDRQLDETRLLFIGAHLETMDEGPRLRLRDFVESQPGGVDVRINVTCQNKACQHKGRISFPFGQSFFLPMEREA